jgi:hypothetical protein
MIVYIDLATNEILAVSKIGEPNNVTSFECPDYVDIAKYDYVPSIQGVYDPNGFVLKEVISEQQTKKQALIDAGFTPEQAELISLL